MADLYRIRDWSIRYETSETRKLKSLSWVRLNNKMDGLAFKLLAKRPDAPSLFCAWVLMLELASKATPRGDLTHNNLPLSPGEMGEITGFPGEMFESALLFLCSPKIAWIDKISPFPGAPVESPGTPGENPEALGFAPDERRKEEKEGKEENPKPGRFAPPSILEVSVYCKERKNQVNPNKWHDHYTARGWMVGKSKMKDWKAAVRTWENNDFAAGGNRPGQADNSHIARELEEGL